MSELPTKLRQKLKNNHYALIHGGDEAVCTGKGRTDPRGY